MKYILPKPHIHLKFSQPIVSSCLRLTVSSCLPDSHGPILACRSNTPPVRRPSYCSPHRLRRFARVFLLRVLSPAATKPAAKMKTRGRRWQACQALICAATKPAAKMKTRGRRWQACQALICAATKPAAKMKTRGRRWQACQALICAATKPAAKMKTRGRRWQACQALICAATKPAAKMKTRGHRWQACQALICAATKPAAKMKTRGAIGDKACTKRMHGIELRSRDEFAIGEVGHHLVGEAFQRGPDTVGCERSEVC